MSVAGVSVRFLGSGDAFGSGARFQTCIYVSCGSAGFAIDCGTSSLIAMRRYGVDPSHIDTVLLTHLHGDHFGGLPFLILHAQLISRRTRPLLIAGPPGLKNRVLQAMEILFPGSSRMRQSFALEFLDLRVRTPTTIGDLVVTAYGVVHPSGAAAYALRIVTGGKVIAYSGDTEWTDALIEAAQDADVFICEAYSFDERIRYHLDYATIMSHQQHLNARRLVLTHMNEDMLARLPRIEAEWAEDGKCFVL